MHKHDTCVCGARKLAASLRCQTCRRALTEAQAAARIPDRFWSKVDRSDADGCWLWTSAVNRDGYGKFWVDGYTTPAHRFAYELLVGPIQDGMVIDHVKALGCVSKRCVRPDHLEAVTHTENKRRGRNVARERTHCLHGHEYDMVNTRWTKDGKRLCRACIGARKSERARLGRARRVHIGM